MYFISIYHEQTAGVAGCEQGTLVRNVSSWSTIVVQYDVTRLASSSVFSDKTRNLIAQINFDLAAAGKFVTN